MNQTFDVIGDIHGHADALEALLAKLGYREENRVYRHPSGRKVIFLGDFIDGGPQNRRVVAIARAMVEASQAKAILGNHEYNAICWHTPHPDGGDELTGWLREHSPEKRRQHQATLDEFAGDSAGLAEMIGWFRSLPLFLDLGSFRAVHACWHEPLLAAAHERLGAAAVMDDAFLVESSQKDSAAYHIVETLLKGLESELPAGVTFDDKYGKTRDRARIRWWRTTADTLDELVIGNAEIYTATRGLPADSALIHGYPPEAPPVFFGHYWLTGRPALQAQNAACLDYSVARGGKLVAYRWDGEAILTPAHFCE